MSYKRRANKLLHSSFKLALLFVIHWHYVVATEGLKLTPLELNLQNRKYTYTKKYNVLPTTGKNCANKKVPFSQINISLLANFECFLEENAFLDKKFFSAKCKNGRFFRNSGRDQVRCHCGPDGPTKFR